MPAHTTTEAPIGHYAIACRISVRPMIEVQWMVVNQGAKVHWSPVRCQFMHLMKLAGFEGNPGIEVAVRNRDELYVELARRGLQL